MHRLYLIPTLLINVVIILIPALLTIVLAFCHWDGISAPSYPAATDPVISVAATDQSDRRSSYTNYGDWIRISGPGNGILSTYWSGASSYRMDSGTSMATAHVTGVLALMLSLRPEMSPADAESIIRATADPVSDSGLGCGPKLRRGP